MPTQQGCRLDEEVPESPAGEQTCEPRQNRSVGRLQCRSVDLASEDRHLVAQHDDLDGEIRVTATDQSDELQDTAERPVEGREGHRWMLAAPESRRQSPACDTRMGVVGMHTMPAPASILCYNNILDRSVRWFRSARRHRIGKAHAMHVISTTDPVRVPATANLDARLVWIGADDRGIELEIVALDLPDAIVVIHVMPTALRR